MNTESSLKCFFCGESGHGVSTCATLASLECPICKNKGHTRKKCPKYDSKYLEKLECVYCRSSGLPFRGHSKKNCSSQSSHQLPHTPFQVPTKEDGCYKRDFCIPLCKGTGYVSSGQSQNKPFLGKLNVESQIVLSKLSTNTQNWFEEMLMYDTYYEAIEELISVLSPAKIESTPIVPVEKNTPNTPNTPNTSPNASPIARVVVFGEKKVGKTTILLQNMFGDASGTEEKTTEEVSAWDE